MGSKKKQKSKEKVQTQALRTQANKIRDWKKHIEKNPNDLQGKKILEDLLKGGK